MKKILSLFFCVLLLLSLTACGPSAPATHSSGNKNTDTSGAESAALLYNPDLEHKFLATDIYNHSIVVFDLNRADGDFDKLLTDECVVWEWDADEDSTCKLKPGEGIDSAKYRYSAYYKKDVIIATSSTPANAYVIDYETKTVLYETTVGNGPHCVEMMPNGDLVVACSVDEAKGYLVYIPLSAGETKPSHRISSPSCHGVSYDPENDCLWVVEVGQIYKVVVKDAGTKKATLVRISGSGYNFKQTDEDWGGHVLSPVYGQPGKYWVAAEKLWMFDSSTEEFTRKYNYSSGYNASDVKGLKGVAYFSDGTMVQTVPGSGGKTTHNWSCGQLRITVIVESSGKVKRIVPKTVKVTFAPTQREFYKVYPFNKNYQ